MGLDQDRPLANETKGFFCFKAFRDAQYSKKDASAFVNDNKLPGLKKLSPKNYIGSSWQGKIFFTALIGMVTQLKHFLSDNLVDL